MPQPADQPATPLNIGICRTLLRDTLDAVPLNTGADQQANEEAQQTAMDMLRALAPRDPIEVSLVGRYVAAHHASMHAFQIAAHTDLPLELVLRFQARATTLARLADSTLRELGRRRKAKATAADATPAQAQPFARPDNSAATEPPAQPEFASPAPPEPPAQPESAGPAPSEPPAQPESAGPAPPEPPAQPEAARTAQAQQAATPPGHTPTTPSQAASHHPRQPAAVSVAQAPSVRLACERVQSPPPARPLTRAA